MSYDGKKWDDTEETLESNVCLKAFTKLTKSSDVGPNDLAPTEPLNVPVDEQTTEKETNQSQEDIPLDLSDPTQNKRESEPVKTTPVEDTKTPISLVQNLDKDSVAVREKAKKLLGFN